MQSLTNCSFYPKVILNQLYMGYFDYLVYMRGGGEAKKPPGLTLAFDFLPTVIKLGMIIL